MTSNESEFYKTLSEVTEPLKNSIRPHRESFKAEPIVPKRNSQCWRILRKFVQNDGILYTGDFMLMYIARYGARIGDLRNKFGWDITTKKIKQGKTRYTLDEDQYYRLYMKKFDIFGDDVCQ